MKNEFRQEIKQIHGNLHFTTNYKIEAHKEETQTRDFKFSNQSLQLKSVARDFNKAKQEIEKLKESNSEALSKIDTLKESKVDMINENNKLVQRCQILEDKINHDSRAVSILVFHSCYSLQTRR